MNYTPKTGERILSESELVTVSANERRSSYYPVGTEFDFSVPIQLIGYESSAKRPLVKFAGVFKNGKETTVPATMIMRVPFQNAEVIEKTEFQKQLNACTNAKAVWDLIKGRKVRVSDIVTVSEKPYGEDTARDVKYSVFDLVQ